jgi:hypothetical protein
VSLHAFCGPRETLPITRPSESIAGPPESPSHVPACAEVPPSNSSVLLTLGSLQSEPQSTCMPPTL